MSGLIEDLDFPISSPPETVEKALYCALMLGFCSLLIELIKIILTSKFIIKSGLETIKINFFIKKTKLLKNGEAPIFVRIIINKERDEYALKKSIEPKHCNESKQLAKSTCDNSLEINQLIELHSSKIKSYFDFMIMDNQEVTPRVDKTVEVVS